MLGKKNINENRNNVSNSEQDLQDGYWLEHSAAWSQRRTHGDHQGVGSHTSSSQAFVEYLLLYFTDCKMHIFHILTT